MGTKILISWGARLAPWAERVTLDVRVVSSSPTLGVEPTSLKCLSHTGKLPGLSEQIELIIALGGNVLQSASSTPVRPRAPSLYHSFPALRKGNTGSRQCKGELEAD